MAKARTDNLVTAPAVSKAIGMPLIAVYRLVDRNEIPYVDVTEAWQRRRQLRFDLDAVRAALAKLGESRRRTA